MSLFIRMLSCTVPAPLMPAGFTRLEAGLVRAKNGRNGTFTNVVNFCISAFMYRSIEFALMVEAGLWGFFSADNFSRTVAMELPTEVR